MLIDGKAVSLVRSVPMTLVCERAIEADPAQVTFAEYASGHQHEVEWSEAAQRGPVFHRVVLGADGAARFVDVIDDEAARAAETLFRSLLNFERGVDTAVREAAAADTASAVRILSELVAPLPAGRLQGPVPVGIEQQTPASANMHGGYALLSRMWGTTEQTLMWTVYRREHTTGLPEAWIDTLDLDDARLLEAVIARIDSARSIAQDLYEKAVAGVPERYQPLDLPSSPWPRLAANATARDATAWVEALTARGVRLSSCLEVPEFGADRAVGGEPLMGRRALLDLGDDLVRAVHLNPDLAASLDRGRQIHADVDEPEAASMTP